MKAARREDVGCFIDKTKEGAFCSWKNILVILKHPLAVITISEKKVEF